ncbi:MAG TPA: hypothetical protein PLO59_10215, partial [Bacteroidia bacterium]|nr:hypothetical protein [Bacteroidia bacterium]
MSDVQPWQFVDDEQDKWPDYIDSIITFSFFTGLISFWWFTNKMQVNFGTFCKVSILISLIILMSVHIYKRFTSIKWVQTTDVMRTLLSGPLLSILVFSLNYLIVGKPYEVTYTIADIRVVAKNEITDEAVVFFDDNALNDFKTLRTF